MSNGPPSRVNDPIRLYTGRAQIGEGDDAFHADAEVSLVWLPSPHIRFAIPAVPDAAEPRLGATSFQAEGSSQPADAAILGIRSSSDGEVYRASLSGRLASPVVHPADAPARYATFSLPNFPRLLCDEIAARRGFRQGHRWTLTGGGWKFTLGPVGGYDEAWRLLEENHGYAVTHNGKMERADGQPFTAREAIGALTALARYTAFVCGRWVAPCVPRGFDAGGRPVWEAWWCGRIEPFEPRTSWMNTDGEQVEAAFPGFMARWQDDDWREVVSLAIHWYVEANGQAGSAEGSIVLAQTALELLAAAEIVDGRRLVNPDSFKSLPAADKLRLLFGLAGLPLMVPSQLPHLLALGRGKNQNIYAKGGMDPDCASVLAWVRNPITHPTKQNRERLGKHPIALRVEAWRLGMWALELCLLWLFGYNGTYANRITQRYSNEVERVPWAVGLDPPPAPHAPG